VSVIAVCLNVPVAGPCDFPGPCDVPTSLIKNQVSDCSLKYLRLQLEKMKEKILLEKGAKDLLVEAQSKFLEILKEGQRELQDFESSSKAKL